MHEHVVRVAFPWAWIVVYSVYVWKAGTGGYPGLAYERVAFLLLLLDNVVGRQSAMILGTIDERADDVGA